MRARDRTHHDVRSSKHPEKGARGARASPRGTDRARPNGIDRCGQHSADQRRHVIDQTADFGIEIAILDRKARALDASDLTRQFEGRDRLDEDVETHLRTELGQLVGGVQTGPGTGDVYEDARALGLAGGTERVEFRPKARMIAAIHGFPQKGSTG